MKIFVDAIKISESKSFAGVILVGDHNQQYFSWTGVLETNQTGASKLAIDRAISFKKNIKPLYCNQDPEVFNNFVNKDMLEKDEYLNQFKIQSVAKFNDAKEESDLEFIKQVKSLTQVSFRQYYLINKNYQRI